MNVLQGGVVSTSPNPQAGGPPLVGCPRLLIQFIRSYPPYRRPFLYSQPEDAPCRGDMDPPHSPKHLLCSYYILITEVLTLLNVNRTRLQRHTRVFCIVEGGEGGSCKANARAKPKERHHRPTCRSKSPAGQSLSRADGPGREVEPRRPRGVCRQGHHSTHQPHPNPSPQPDTAAPEQPKVTATRQKARPKKT